MKLLALLFLPLLLLGRVLWSDPSEPLPAEAVAPPSAEEALQQTALPWRDLVDLAERLKGVPPEAVVPAEKAPADGRQLGERASFWVADQATNSYYTVQATLEVESPHAYMYVADGMRVDQAKLQEAAGVFEDRIYQGDRRYFGNEQPLGLDGDPHITILHANIPGLGGYFTSVDEYPRTIHPYSNERKMLYINVQAVPPGSTGYYGVLAHEFEHMIQWNTSKVEQTWVKEGSAEVATEAARLGSSGAARTFEAKPDTQLNGWAEPSKGDVVPHYGAAYLFISYFLEHYGGYQGAADLLSGGTRGPDSFDRYLSAHGYGKSFEDVFQDWTVANYLDEQGAPDPAYRYGSLSVRVPATDVVTSSTGWRDRTVNQFGSDYVELGGNWSTALFRFQGDQTTRALPAVANSGRYLWWSNRDDLVDTSLTRAFDLTGVSSATLRFWAWYDLEEGFDYGYVMASTDGGKTWASLPATSTTADDPNGNNLGNGFTGKSGGGKDAGWTEQEVNLGGYAGQSILLRFEQVTDDAYNAPGFAVDDISIPELDYSTDAEADDGGWTPEGFIRTDGVLPQRFSVQLITIGDSVGVEKLPISGSDGGEMTVQNPGGEGRAVLVISGLTRHTSEPARYRYDLELTP